MDERSRQVAALKAIIQTLIPEAYWSQEDESPDEERFFEMVEGGEPVAIAIANELTREEIAEACSWGERGDGSIEAELRTTPVMAFLTDEQRERVRVILVAELEADKASGRAHEAAKGSCEAAWGAEERLRPYEEQFVVAMARDLVEQRGEDALDSGEGSVDERVERFPEPWRSRARKELARLRENVAGMLERKAERATSGEAAPGG